MPRMPAHFKPAGAESKVLDYGRRKKWWRNGLKFRYYCNHQLLEGVTLRGKNVLDVGCGNGRYSLWVAARGAKSVLGLEPSVEGSRSQGPVDDFRSAVRELGFSNVDVQEVTLQDFDPGARKWDVIMILAAINHLNEPATISLLEDPKSWETFSDIGRKLRSLLAPGGTLIVTDCGRKNYYGDRGLKNPYAPTIEWYKHQEPETWARVLGEAGFGSPRISWLDPSAWPVTGFLTRNRWWAYRHDSVFRLVLRAG